MKQGFRWIPVALKAGIATIHRQIKEKLLFRDAQELIRKAEPESGKNSISPGEEILYTASIIHELNRFQTQEELLAFRFSREEDAGILLVDCMLHKACILIRSGMGSVFQNWQKSMNISVSQPIFTWNGGCLMRQQVYYCNRLESVRNIWKLLLMPEGSWICWSIWQKYIILAGTMKNARLFLHCWRLK